MSRDASQTGIYIRMLAREPLPYHLCGKRCLIGTSEFAVQGRIVYQWTERHGISVAMTVSGIPHTSEYQLVQSHG